jgi:hypothetical protein
LKAWQASVILIFPSLFQNGYVVYEEEEENAFSRETKYVGRERKRKIFYFTVKIAMHACLSLRVIEREGI